jgi:hypothetical protein
VRQDPEQHAEVWAAIETRAVVAAPLVRDGRLTAATYVNFRAFHRWTEDELTLIEDVASRTWAAVERARAKAALSASEQRFRAAVAAMEGVLWTNNAVGKVSGEQPLPGALITGFASLSDAQSAGVPRLTGPFRSADLARLLSDAVDHSSRSEAARP